MLDFVHKYVSGSSRLNSAKKLLNLAKRQFYHLVNLSRFLGILSRTVFPTAKYFKNYMFLAHKHFIYFITVVSEVWRTLAKRQLRKYSFHEPQKISLTTTHPQKFLRQRLTRRNFWDKSDNDSSGRNFWDNNSSAEISETRIHRNFWDNGPAKFLGQRCTKISGTIRTYKFLRPLLPQKFLRPLLGQTFLRPFRPSKIFEATIWLQKFARPLNLKNI